MADNQGSWRGHPFAASALRLLVAVVPLATSLVFVAIASRLVPSPTSSLPLFVLWWLGIAGGGMLVVVGTDVLARKALPLAALLKLSLIFPDKAPSRFRTALRSSSTRQLRAAVDGAQRGDGGDTPSEAAERLLRLVAALNAHDRLTRGHSERVRAYTRMIAEELSLPARDVALLHWAGLLHDVGKLEVPAEILNKPTCPTADEWEILKRHPEAGMRLIEPLREWLGSWADAVGQHHERWDGAGYPNGVAGTDIAFAARIVSVADVFDVITSVRSYKKSEGAVAAREEITRCAGTQFDPKVVRAFLNISIGRLRLAMGPLSWLAHVPSMSGLSLTPAIGSALSTLAVGVGALIGGVVTYGDTPSQRDLETSSVVAAAARFAPAEVDAVTEEDVPIVVRLTSLDDVPELRRLAVRRSDTPGASAQLVGGRRVRVVPPIDYNGDLTFRFRACRDSDCSSARLRVAVRPVDDPPAAVDDFVTGREDTAIWISPLANDRDVDDTDLSLRVDAPSNGNVHQYGTRVQFEPPPDFSGVVTIPYRASDRSSSTAAEIRIRVDAVDDAPEFTAGPPVIVNEDSGPQTITGWTPGSSPGPPDEAGQTVRFVAANDNSALFKAAPTVEPDGTLRFTPAMDANGTATLSIRAVNNMTGANTSPVRTATITVDAVNDTPTFTAGSPVIVDEDAGPQTFVGWATGVSPGPVDEAGQTLTFTVTNDDPALFSTQPALASDGTLTFASAADANGSAVVSIRVADDGGTARGGTDTSRIHTATVRVRYTNDAPAFTVGSPVVVDEDAGPQTVVGWATGISPGPVDEAGQIVTVTVTNDDPALFSTQPALAADGTLTLTPAANANGVATVSIRAVDDGGGTDTSPVQTTTITIDPVNDAPNTGPDSATTNEDSPGITIEVLANDTDVDGDPMGVVGVDASALIGGTLSDDGAGNVTYIPDPDFNGTEVVTYEIGDGNGGNATGTLTITVVPVPDAPVAGADSYATPEDTPLVAAAPAVLGNDYDVDGDPLTLATTPVSGPNDGSVALAADGSFTYVPDPGFRGTDTFAYRLDDGTGRTSVAVVSITVDSGATTSTLYFDTSGASATNYDMTTTPPPAAAPVPDIDADGDPGLTVKKSNGNEAVSGAPLFHEWTYRPVAPMTLDGPVKVDLWSSLRDFRTGRAGHPWVYLYDCATGGSACVKIAQTDVHLDPWNTGATWTNDTFTIGSVSRTIAAGRELTVRILQQHEDLWIATTAAYPSGLSVTLGNQAPVPADDTFTVLEDAVGTPVDVVANDTDVNLEPTSVSIVVPPGSGTATTQTDGTVAYLPNADWSGSDSFVYRVCDTGGLCSDANSTVTVLPVNDTPSFIGGPALAVSEDSGTQTVAGWATGLVTGPADEAGQSIVFTANSDNPTLFSSGPAVASDGTLTFTAVPDAFGSATVSVRAVDDGGTANGGGDTSAPAVITITITAVNDVPSFTIGPDITVNAAGGAQTIIGLAGTILAGPANEAGQSVTFTVSTADGTLFATPPTIAPDGTLTFTPSGTTGTTVVTVAMSDDGGTAGGGTDTSPPVTFTITLT